MTKPPHAGGHTWYVTFRNPDDNSRAYVRNSVRFKTEIEAKHFAAQKLGEGCDVSAGTINPHHPKRTIGPLLIERWLDEASASTFVDGRNPLSGNSLND